MKCRQTKKLQSLSHQLERCTTGHTYLLDLHDEQRATARADSYKVLARAQLDMLVGIVGKPSAGKSTLLNALAKTNAKVGDYPFTTIEANNGVGYVAVDSVCTTHGVKCAPNSGTCNGKTRMVPVELLDVAGLVPGASEGKGLGNRFLDDLRTADVLVHVVDCSGSLDAEGNTVEKGSWDPLKDIEWLEQEIAHWIKGIISKDWDTTIRKADAEKLKLADIIHTKLTGLRIQKLHVNKAVDETTDRTEIPPLRWSDNELLHLAMAIRRLSKPIVIAANKIDQATSAENFERLVKEYDGPVLGLSALSEIALQNLADEGAITYEPGSSHFSYVDEESLSSGQQRILQQIQTEILDKHGSTGVIQTLNAAVFDVMKMVVAFPVEDPKKLCDHDGRVLPDAFLVPSGTTTRRLAGKVHTDLEETFLHGILSPVGRRIGADYEVQSGDIIKIVATAK